MSPVAVGFSTPRQKSLGITLTTAAAARIRQFMAKNDRYLGVRLSIKRTGCSGLGYEVSFVEQLEEHDQVFESQGIKIFVADKNLAFLEGVEIDFSREGVNSSFKFNNPNATGTCGCGESFSVN